MRRQMTKAGLGGFVTRVRRSVGYGILLPFALGACGSSTDVESFDCFALVYGRWEGTLSGSPFVLRIRLVNPESECPGRGGVVEGSTELAGDSLLGYGAFEPSKERSTLTIGLVPFHSWCQVSDAQQGDAITLSGEVDGDSFTGTVEGGWREAAAGGGCDAVSDTAFVIDPTPVTLIRGS